MKKHLIAIWTLMWTICPINLFAANSLKILVPDPSTVYPSSKTFSFIDTHYTEGTSVSIGLFVVASGTNPWVINVLSDPFKLENSTITIPFPEVTYMMFGGKNPVDDMSRFLPTTFNSTSPVTVYTSTTTEYTTSGTTLTLSIGVNAEKAYVPIGRYHANLHIELK